MQEPPDAKKVRTSQRLPKEGNRSDRAVFLGGRHQHVGYDSRFFGNIWDLDSNNENRVLLLLLHYTGFRLRSVIPRKAIDLFLKPEDLQSTVHFSEDSKIKVLAWR